MRPQTANGSPAVPNSIPHGKRFQLFCASLAIAAGLSGCATVAGVAVSPITGGVDLARRHANDGGTKIAVPFVFVGGALAGPFAALWNGLRLDGSYASSEGRRAYWREYPEVFQPFEMIDRHGLTASRRYELTRPSGRRGRATDRTTPITLHEPDRRGVPGAQ